MIAACTHEKYELVQFQLPENLQIYFIFDRFFCIILEILTQI